MDRTGCSKIWSYDTGFDVVAAIRRIERPGPEEAQRRGRGAREDVLWWLPGRDSNPEPIG